MQKHNFLRFSSVFLLFLLIQVANVSIVNAQKSENSPELSVAGIELGNRESAKKFLTSGYSPRPEEDGRASFYFYNEWGTQVMRLTADSMDDPYYLTEIEVFGVGESYTNTHYVAKDFGIFTTENGIFIGYKQSVASIIIGIPNVGRKNRIGPKDVIDIKGEPLEREKTDKDREFVTYEIPGVKLSDGSTAADYNARYEFYKKKLRRFSIKINVKDKQTDTAKLNSEKNKNN